MEDGQHVTRVEREMSVGNASEEGAVNEENLGRREG